MTASNPTDSVCPVCDRFIGRVIRCPYCGEDTRHRHSVIFLWFAASLLSIGGILLLLIL